KRRISLLQIFQMERVSKSQKVIKVEQHDHIGTARVFVELIPGNSHGFPILFPRFFAALSNHGVDFEIRGYTVNGTGLVNPNHRSNLKVQHASPNLYPLPTGSHSLDILWGN